MKFELIGKNNYLEPIETVLINREIDDIQSFMSISEKDVLHWSKLKNIERAVSCLLQHIKKGNKIFIQIDPDIDGNAAAALLISHLTTIFPTIDIQWRLQEGKEHGIIIENIPDNINLVIVPDAGSNQFKEHSLLKKSGVDIIVLDHHECDEESNDAIVVNSQISPEYSNKQFSGVGVVYKFCKALDDKLNVKLADKYLDLVAIGNIADSQDMRSPETRYFAEKGLKNIKNKLIKELFKKQSYSTKGVINITSTSFYINPLLNACIRVGTMQEKEQMFRALLESDEEIYYKRKNINEPIEKNTARILGNLKAKQDRMRNKGVELITERIDDKKLLSNKVLIVDTTEILHKNLNGLVANKLAETYRRPTILFRKKEENEQILRGSGRGYDKGIIKDLKQFLNNTNKFIFCEGHANAHGFEIEAQKLIEANELINDQLGDFEDIDYHQVDFVFTNKNIPKEFILELSRHKDLWGYKVEEPLIAITEVEINKDEIYLNGKTSKTLKFENWGIEYIKPFSNEDEWKTLKSKGERLVLNIVGKCTVNEWNGKIKPQIAIEDYEVVKVKKKEFVF
ncbi:DHH family phosphoesterase [Bacillus sp. Bva_UNVM-123]|uniref:DHH family phosphoesterase n=1 Tax=Bacillus sp. Bva_UNVM-123 TaxID=2829798 RepID=UPI00391F2AE3